MREPVGWDWLGGQIKLRDAWFLDWYQFQRNRLSWTLWTLRSDGRLRKTDSRCQWWIDWHRWEDILFLLRHGLCNLFLMLQWIASDWCLEGSDRSTSCPSMSKFPRGFWVVKSVKARAASLIEVNPVRICADGEPGSWAIAAIILWRVSACHSAVCSINACCCCSYSWKTWAIANAEAGAGVVTPPGPTIRGNCENGEEDELTVTFVAVFLLTLLVLGDMF